MTFVTAPARTADAILPAVLPAAARAVRAHGAVAAALQDAGASVVGSPDVEIGAVDELQGDAPVVVALVDAGDDALDGGTAARPIVRAADHLRMRMSVNRAKVVLRSRGLRVVAALPWDRGQVVHLPSPSVRPPSLRRSERLPRRAAVVATAPGTPHGASILDAALAESGEIAGRRPWPLVRSGTLVVVGERAVTRVAVGPARHRLDRAARAITALEGSGYAHLLPSVLAAGRAGLGQWSRERRLDGTPCRAEDVSKIEADVVAVAAAMFTAVPSRVTPVEAIAADIGAALQPEARELCERLRAAAAAVAPLLDGLPGGMVHGDLWHGNLLVRDGALTGVIDWDAAGAARLPFLDLLHLRVAARVPRGSQQWGREVVRELRAGTVDAPMREYARLIGVRIDGDLRRALVVAYWLDRLAHQIGTYADRAHRPKWLDANVATVVTALPEAMPA